MLIVKTILLLSGILLVVTGGVLALLGQRGNPMLGTVGGILLIAGFADLLFSRFLIARMMERERKGPPPAG
jgi:hypothetical protein